MAEVSVPFPVSASPGQFPGEGTGDLINVYAERNGDELSWGRVAGLKSFASIPGFSGPRGFIYNESVLYGAFDGKLASITSAGVATALLNGLAGSDPVSMAINNAAPTKDVVIVSENGAFIVSGGSVLAYPDADVGFPNSVSFLMGYFIFTYGSGRIVASDLNTSAIAIDSFASAEAKPDGLLRGIAFGDIWYGFGPESTEIWQNVGEIPFPLRRATVMPVGLFGQWAVAGDRAGWDRELMFVASDGTVRRMQGYSAEIISTPDVVTDINRLRFTPELVRADVYTAGENAVFVLSAPEWTWEFNLTTGTWNKRRSQDLPRWIGSGIVKAFGSWVVGSWSDERLFTLDEFATSEALTPLVAQHDSGPVKDFPRGIRVPSAYFDFTVGVGQGGGDEPVADPKVSISWSHDGGLTWASPIVRRLGRQGESFRRIEVGPLGTATHHGIRLRWECSDPVRVKFRGARIPGAKEKRTAKDAG
jgi:hypothetical protein